MPERREQLSAAHAGFAKICKPFDLNRDGPYCRLDSPVLLGGGLQGSVGCRALMAEAKAQMPFPATPHGVEV